MAEASSAHPILWKYAFIWFVVIIKGEKCWQLMWMKKCLAVNQHNSRESVELFEKKLHMTSRGVTPIDSIRNTYWQAILPVSVRLYFFCWSDHLYIQMLHYNRSTVEMRTRNT